MIYNGCQWTKPCSPSSKEAFIKYSWFSTWSRSTVVSTNSVNFSKSWTRSYRSEGHKEIGTSNVTSADSSTRTTTTEKPMFLKDILYMLTSTRVRITISKHHQHNFFTIFLAIITVCKRSIPMGSWMTFKEWSEALCNLRVVKNN